MSVTKYDYLRTDTISEVDIYGTDFEQRFPGEGAERLLGMAKSLQRTFRCKFGWVEDTQEVALHLFYDDCPLAMGTIGFGRTQDSSYDYFFYVEGPHISNGRYAEWREQHYMAMSKDADKALANAKRYLRTPNVFECANFYWRKQVRRDFTDAVNTEKAGLRNLQNNISNNDDVLCELEYMHRSGHTFQSAKLAKQVDEWLSYKDESAHTKTQRGSEVVYVYAKPDGSIDACRFLAEHWEIDPHGNNNTEQVREVSDDMRGKVAALTICEDDSHVDLVGTRIANNCFFVYA